tara:strand:+ start:539 stop:919 length:381 start_codon:yes stop_codon:yes gene_type:complete
MLKLIFQLYNITLIILYLFPGSLIGLIFYKNVLKQPQITSDFLNISSNHFYAFFILTALGILTVKKTKILILYLIVLSIVLEISHIILPNRSFQHADLIGNITGVILPLLILIIYKFFKKKYFLNK